MRLPHVRSFTAGFTTSLRDDRRDRSYHVSLWEQPAHRWLAACVYHWYDMRVCRLPGFQVLEAFKEWRYRNRDPLEYMPISAVQDCRCYFLEQRGKTVLAALDVPPDVYGRLTGKPSPT